MRLDLIRGQACAPRVGRRLRPCLGALVLLMSLSAPTRADEPRASSLKLVHDGKGHYLAYEVRRRVMQADGKLHMAPGLLYVGERKRFWLLERDTSQEDPQGVHFDFMDFRFATNESGARSYGHHAVDGDDSALTVECGSEQLRFVPVGAKERAKILKSAAFDEFSPSRVPIALLRDDDGNYYFIDQSSDRGRRYDRSLYVGRRGNLTRVSLKDVLIDVAGELYLGKTGKLRITRERGSATRAVWIDKHGAERPLTLVAMDISLEHAGFAGVNAFIYTDLGVYLGKKLGTPCDWL